MRGHRLSALAVKNAKPGKHADGDGLWLFVRPGGAASWVLRFKVNGVERSMGLGSRERVSLAEARAKARKAHEQIGEGLDPITARSTQRASEAVTFKQVAESFIAGKGTGWCRKRADPC